jgi:DNA relaxase NicK
MPDKTLEDAYQNLLKDNTRLHAEKKHIVDSAAKHIKQAESTIGKLQSIIDSIVSDAVHFVEELPKSDERDAAIRGIRMLAPLKLKGTP